MTTGYLVLTLPYALALVSGQVDTIPLWDEPGPAMGQRVAIVGQGWHVPTALNLVELQGVKFDRRDFERKGRVGSVLVAGWVRVAEPWSRKGIAGANWPKRPVPRQNALVHWRIEAPEVEIGQSVTGLQRLAVSYEDRPQFRDAVRNYGREYGIAALPQDCRALYEEIRNAS